MNNKRKYIVSDPNKISKDTKDMLFFEGFKGESLSNIIDYYVLTNYSNSDFIEGSPDFLEDKEYKELINNLDVFIKTKQ
jgi:hypothetical protein